MLSDGDLPCRGFGPIARLVVMSSCWLLLCTILYGDFGAVPEIHMPSPERICESTTPLLGKAVDGLPTTYGACGDVASSPPGTCMGNAPLYSSAEGSGYVRAQWVTGLNTMRFNTCELRRLSLGNVLAPTRKYQLTVGGKFDRLSLYLDVKQCAPVGGCAAMSGSDSCCGEDISFNFTFTFDCGGLVRPSGRKELESIELNTVRISPMVVELKLLNGAITVDALDIAETLSDSLKYHLDSFVQKERIQWGRRSLNVAQFMDQIIHFNAPHDACFEQ